ncbi:MAG: PD-(D/E)XK nuclease family protein [Thermodesulfovibrionales bacterium]|nr:PD-(D/E)XK nuclease family protein [Thermodesulfovibrionales bacterium]
MEDFLLTHRDETPLYKTFQRVFKNLWDEFFDELFRLSGYLPLYELMIGVLRTFRLFEIKPQEEASLIKILETIKNFESSGVNSLKDFLDFARLDSLSSEWEIALPTNSQAAKVMTIHQSKGLGFPIVIAILYGDTNKGFDYIFEESSDAVALLKINSQIAQSSSELMMIYEEERIKEAVNKLNTLYVGLTRAEKELYVIGVKSKRDGYPFYFFPSEDYQSGCKELNSKKDIVHTLTPLELFYNLEIKAEAILEDEVLNLSDKLWGEYIHRVLSFIDFVTDGFDLNLSEIIKSVNRLMKIEHPLEEIRDIIEKIVYHDNLREFFIEKPNRTIKNEMEVVSSSGRLFRMDRVIIDPERVAIIEYKTGSDRKAQEKHILQVKNYARLLQEIFPKKELSTLIAYIDMKDTVSIMKVK